MSKSDTKKEVIVEEEISLNVILKFIKPFDGDRNRLTAFIRNCDSAISLASSEQEEVVCKYILSQLEGKAECACSIKEFDNWPCLKEFLKNQFGERKHYAHLLTDLQDCRQASQESVSQFSLRVETCLQKLLTEVTVSNTKKGELSGRIAAMEDLALHTFVLGLIPRIAYIVRSRDYKTLNEAINAAISEEKIQQFTYRNHLNRSKPTETPKRNEFLNKHKSETKVFISSGNQPNTSAKDSPFCRYCKRTGHLLENCKLREFNNKRFSNGPQPFTPVQSSSSNSPGRRVNFTDNCEEDGLIESDQCNDYLN